MRTTIFAWDSDEKTFRRLPNGWNSTSPNNGLILSG